MNIITENWGIIVAVVGPVAAWFGSRKFKELQLKRAKAETIEVELNTISSNFKVYQNLINDLD